MTGSSKKDTDLFLITGEQLEIIQQRRGSNYLSCQGKFRDEIINKVRSRPYAPEQEKATAINGVLDEIMRFAEASLNTTKYRREYLFIQNLKSLISELRQQAPAQVDQDINVSVPTFDKVETRFKKKDQ